MWSFVVPSGANWPRLPLVNVTAGIVCCLVSAAVTGPVLAAEPSPADLQFFESKIRPLLVENCQGCHGSQKQWAGLRLDRRDALLKGGESGATVNLQEPAKSLLIQAVRQTGDIVMPPEGELSPAQIADLEEWIRRGVPFPADEQTVAHPKGYRDPNHWSFQPRQRPEVPEVSGSSQSHGSGIDAWITAKLAEQKLQLGAPASKRELLRRVTFDLTGLPPTPAEVQSFLADNGPDAWARVIDRLLDNPAYGERWGRHWLDVARYADSNGLDENVAHGNAWKYRDYVVEAFNADLPFDRFVIEQLAGDLLPADTVEQRHRQIIATGFLSLGAKVIAEVDAVKMQMDIIDEQIDTVGRAFMGLTLGCARCHDHKFDPISTANYYGLAGVLKSTRTMESFVKVARWYENPLPTPESDAAVAAHAAQVNDLQSELNRFIAAADQAVIDAMTAGATVPDKKEPLYPEATKSELKKLRDRLKQLQQAAPEVPSAMGVAEGEVSDVAIHIRGSHLKLGEVAPRHVPEVVRAVPAPKFPADQSGRLQFAQWLTHPEQPLTPRVIVNRVWRWHFGRGLVASTDNFGVLGDQPSHPELLDWLANEFVAHGWSLKWLHREILQSHTYQQTAHATEQAMAIDVDNRWYSRFPVRRLEAEELRDALLAVSGQLDRQAGGPVLTVKNRGYLFDHTSKDLTSYDSVRRSIYLPVIRNNVYDLFQLLDFPDAATPSGDRNTTTVAPQALLMLNSQFMLQASDHLARRLLTEFPDDTARLKGLLELACQREITASELAEQQQYLTTMRQALREVPMAPSSTATGNQPDPELLVWSTLCQAVLASNEFLYVN